MKKKYLIISISFLLVLSICLYVFMGNNDEKVIFENESSSNHIVNTNALTMMYETEAGSGEYQVSSDIVWPQEGYVFNETLSKCENGSDLIWDEENKKVLMQANTSDKCYVYFDIITEINFSIYFDGRFEELIAISGMNWETWVNSKYNTSNYLIIINSNGIIFNYGQPNPSYISLSGTEESKVYASDFIIDGYEYILYTHHILYTHRGD